MSAPRYFAILLFLVLAIMALECFELIARAAAETVKDMLAAQVRSQGIVCDKPLQAMRDAKRSKPDHDVWILTCENATYRVSRYPDLAAKIERVR
jgi:ABC-type transport system involved in cytochrome bd biosynthesis fused ATPase/permease subunit